MFRNKSDVDKRVSALLYHAKNEHERNLRCYNIALLYYKAHDFESAQRYATMYLSVRDDSAAAHKLLGQAFEKLGQKDKAIASYTKSLKLESDQSDLILKICELLCEKDIEFDPQLARYWSDRASLMFPHSPPVFMLKEKLMMSDSSLPSKDLEELLHAELKTKPTDMNVRVKLLKLYAETGRVELAVNHAFEVEARQAHNNSLIWYQCINNICKIYNRDNFAKCSWEFYLQWISVLDRLCLLCISETSGICDISEITENIYNLDQTVYQANRCSKGPEMFKEFLKYISAQIVFFMGILLLKKAKKENINWKEIKKLVSPLFFLASSPPPSADASWTLSAKESYRKHITFWVHRSNCRIVQAGYILISLSKENHSEKLFIDKVSHFISNDWRQQVFEKTFHGIDQINGSTSHFLTRIEFSKVLLKVPSNNSLKSSSLVSSFEQANFGSLHHLVWLGLQQLKKTSILEIKLPSFRTTCFNSLQFTISNLNNIGVETINQLDIDTFLYATVFCVAAAVENQKNNGFLAEEWLHVLPAVITPQLCSSEQSKWWTNVCSLIKGPSQVNSSESISDLRFNLQRGLEVTRGEGLPPLLMVAIARTFASRALISDIIEESDGCHARALHLWKLVYPVLERFISNKSLIKSSKINSLFDFPMKDLNIQDAKSLLEEAKFYIGCHYMNTNQYEKAIEEFKVLKSPQAIFNLAMVYQKWAEEQVEGLRGEEITSEIRCRHVVLASKAREYLVKVKTLIRNDSKHPLYSSIETKLFDIDDMLARIEPENGMSERDANGTLDDSVSGGSGGTPGFGELNVVLPPSHHRNRLHHTSTPRRIQEQKTNNFNMSELIDLLSVQHSTNQLKMQQVLEQVRLVVDKIEIVTSEQRSLIDGLTSRFNSFEAEIRNNLAEIRKDMKRPDICNMFEEDDYTDEMLQYQNYSQYYSHPQRTVQNSASAIPYGNQYFSPRLDPLYQGNISFYNQGALPFSEGQQLPDFLRTIPPGNHKVVQPLLHPSQSGIQGALSHITSIPNTSKTPPVHAGLIPNSVMMPAETLPQVSLQPQPPPLSVSIPPPSSRLSSVSGAPHDFQIPLPPQPKPVLNIEERVEEETPPPAYDPLPDFKPLVPLPKEVEICTGEEEEEILFERKAKLFRFINSEWRERGVGNLKILKHKVSGKFRIVMRREQVHKICANHFLTLDVTLEPKANADKAWVWVANDFADEDIRIEKFCAKFKSPEDSAEFKKVFDTVKKELQSHKGKPTIESNSAIDLYTKANDIPSFAAVSSSPLANTFKMPYNLNLSTSAATKILPPPLSGDSSMQDTLPQNKTTIGGFSFSLSKPKLKIPEEPKEIKVDTNKENNPFSKLNFVSPPSASSISTNNFSSVFGGKGSASSGNDKSKSVLELKKTFGDTKSDFVNKENEFVFAAQTITEKSKDNIDRKSSTSVESAPLQPLSSVIKSIPGSWECDGCYIRNKSDQNLCEACGNKRPGISGQTKVSHPNTVSDKPSLSSLVKNAPGSWECNSCYIRNKSDQNLCEACGNKRPGSIVDTSAKNNSGAGFVFGMPPQSEADTPKFTFASSSGLFNFPSNSTFSFGAMTGNSIKESPAASAFTQKPNELSISSSQPFKTGPNCKFGTPTFQFTMPEPKVTSPVINKSLDESHESEQEEEEGDHLQFQPVIPLPEKITVVTGEENETVLYCHRAKLFRYDSSTKEWKERGVGDVKILKHNDSGKIRFLMRRDQVMKICLNHFISDEIVLRPKDDKTWLWYAVDYSEGIQTKEQFAIRFKSSDIANEFKDAFDKAQESLSLDTSVEAASIQKQGDASSTTNEVVQDANVSNSDSDLEIIYEQKAPPDLVQKALALKLPANFYCYLEKPPCPGCCGCETDNEDEVEEVKMGKSILQDSINVIRKPQTQESQPLFKETNQGTDTTKSTIFGYNPNITSAAGFSFASALQNVDSAESNTSKENSELYFFQDKNSFCNPTSQNTIFGVTLPSKTEQISSGVPFREKEKFSFGSSIPEKPMFADDPETLTFGSIAAKSTGFRNFGGSKDFTWEGAGSKLFTDPNKVSKSAVKNNEDEDDDDDENKNDDDHDPQYDPIVPLPDKIELKTGEEDEDVVFIERGQLYRYDSATKEWKQRGIGEMKILKNKTKNIYRLVMRREQVHKLVCNHLINADFELKNKTDKAFCWFGLNFCPEKADDKPVSENLCIKFKLVDTAYKFKSAIENCVETLKAEELHKPIL